MPGHVVNPCECVMRAARPSTAHAVSLRECNRLISASRTPSSAARGRTPPRAKRRDRPSSPRYPALIEAAYVPIISRLVHADRARRTQLS